MIMIVVMMMMMSSVFSVLAGGAYFMTQPQEGDECKGTSVGGNYVIDEDGDCVLDYCDYGYTESNGGCVVVVPDGEEDGGGSGSGSGGGGGGGGGATQLPVGRFVRFTLHEGAPSKYVLTPKEIRVLDKNGINIAINRPTETGGNHGTSQGSNAVDGTTGTLWHSRHGGDTDWIEIDLGYEDEIAKIEIVNVTGTTEHHTGLESRARMSGGGEDSTDKGSYIIIKNADGEEIRTTGDIKFVAQTYTYDFTRENPRWE